MSSSSQSGCCGRCRNLCHTLGAERTGWVVCPGEVDIEGGRFKRAGCTAAHKVWMQHLTVAIYHLFCFGKTDPLKDLPLDLSFSAHRIDDIAAVVACPNL